MSYTTDLVNKSNDLLLRVQKMMPGQNGFIGDPSINASGNAPFLPSNDSTLGMFTNNMSFGPAGSTNIQPDAHTRVKNYFLRKQNEIHSNLNYGGNMNNVSVSQCSSFPGTGFQSKRNRLNSPSEVEVEPLDLDVLSTRPVKFKKVNVDRIELEERFSRIYCKSNVANPVDTEDKMEVKSSRNLEEEGFFVQDRVRAKTVNYIRMSNRLSWDDPHKDYYFNPNGKLNNDAPIVVRSRAPPTKKFRKLPIDLEHFNDLTSFDHAQSWYLEDLDVMRILNIEISKVKFESHFLSIEEEKLAEIILKEYDTIIKDMERAAVKPIKKKIASLRDDLERFEKVHNEKLQSIQDPDKREAEIAKAEAFIKQTLEKILSECENQDNQDRDLRHKRDSLQLKFNELKQVRERQGFTATPISIKWKKFEFNKEQQAKQEARFEEKLNRRASEYLRLAKMNGNDKLTHEGVLEKFRKNHVELGLPLPGDKLWKPELVTTNVTITPDEFCPKHEVLRRQRKKKARIYVRLRIGNSIDITSQRVPFEKSETCFIAYPGLKVELQVMKIPPQVRIEVYECGYCKDRLIEFVDFDVLCGHEPDFNVVEFSIPPKGIGNYYVASVVGRCYVEPVVEAGILMNVHDEADTVKASLKQDPSRFTSIQALLEHLEDHDPNDPYMAAILASVSAQRTAERLSGKFKLDSQSEAASFSTILPTTISQQIQQHIMRLQNMQIEADKKKKFGDPDEKEDPLTLQSVVKSTYSPSFFSLLGWFGSLFHKRRPLRPRPPSMEPTCHFEYYTKLVIFLEKALYVPSRSRFGIGPSSEEVPPSDEYQPPYGGAEPELFVRICFDDAVQLSSAVTGDWNESMEFMVCPDDGNIPSIRELSQRIVRIDLFDHVAFETTDSDYLTEERFLATVELPLSAMWSEQQRLSGSIPMVTPPVQLGYSTEMYSPIRLVASFSFKPDVTIPENPLMFEEGENYKIRERAAALMEKLQSKRLTPKRRIVSFCNLYSNTSLILCRVIYPIAPPSGYQEPLLLVNLVSTIPYAANTNPKISSDTVATCKEFLKQGYGGYFEHSVLLCNLLLFVGRDAFVVIGDDLLVGHCSYVLLKNGSDNTIINPVTGTLFNSTDVSCTLTNVGVVFNNENIYFNIQDNVLPSKIDWNLSNAKKWTPFFDKKFTFVPSLCDKDEINWSTPDMEKAEELEKQIFDAIKASIEEDRDQLPTEWNDEISQVLKEALKKINKLHITQQLPDYHSIHEFIQSDYGEYRMNGVPFKLSFTNMSIIINEIRSQGIFVTELEKVEFSLAIYVIPNPCNIYTVWVFLASVQRVPGGNLIADDNGAHAPRKRVTRSRRMSRINKEPMNVSSDDQLPKSTAPTSRRRRIKEDVKESSSSNVAAKSVVDEEPDSIVDSFSVNTDYKEVAPPKQEKTEEQMRRPRSRPLSKSSGKSVPSSSPNRG